MAKAKRKTSHDSQVALCASVVFPNNSSSKVEWIMDYDASKHMTGDASLFTSYDCRGYLVPTCLSRSYMESLAFLGHSSLAY